MIKQPGLCSLCGTECFEIKLRYDDKFRHLNGRVRQVGKPHDNAWKVTLLLTNGARMDLTVCSECLATVEQRVPELWNNVLESYREELSDAYRADLQLPLFDAERKLKEMRFIVDSPPVGVFYYQRCKNG